MSKLNKATQENVNALAEWCIRNSLSPIESLEWIKSNNYQLSCTYDSELVGYVPEEVTHYQAKDVANVMQGILLCEAMVKSGNLKATKTKGLQWS